MNSPKTNTYPKYYEVSNEFYIATAANTVSPRHSVFMTQVILTTCDKSKYTSKVIANCLPSQFLHLWDWFCDLQLQPPLDQVFGTLKQANWHWEACSTRNIYIRKFMVAYASLKISRWVTGRCLMTHAMHCIMNHDVWSGTRDLVSQSFFSLFLISTAAGMVNDL